MLLYVQLISTDSTDSDVTPAHRPIIVAACHDVIDGHLPLSWQRDVTVQEAAGRCASQVAVKVEQTDIDDDVSTLRCIQQDSTTTASDMSTTDVPQCRRHSPPANCYDDDDDDDEMQPLDLTQRRVCASSAADRLTACAQILLLKGERYEILPVGNGRWISRNEFEIMSALQNGADSHRRRPSLSDQSSSDRPHSNSNCTRPDDDAENKRLDDVNGNTCDVSTQHRCAT